MSKWVGILLLLNHYRSLPVSTSQSPPAPEDTEVHSISVEVINAERKLFLPKWMRSRKTALVLSALALIIASSLLVTVRTYSSVAVDYPQVGQKVDKPLIVTLNQSLGELSTQDIAITPVVEGDWEHISGNVLGDDQLVFKPKNTFAVNTTYVVIFPTAPRLLGGQTEIQQISFKTEPAPGITDYGLPTLAEGTVVPADYTFEIKLAEPNDDLRKLSLRTAQQIEFTSSIKDNTTYVWKPTKLLPQGQAISLELYDTKNQVSLLSKNLTVATEPSANELTKHSLIGPTEAVTLTFPVPINPDYGSYVAVDAEGQGAWVDNMNYTFTPKGLEAGKTYTISIKAGLRSQAGGILQVDQSRTFSTIGPVSVQASSPHGNGLSQASQKISFTFDQAVEQASAESRFSITSGSVSTKSWSGNTLTITVVNLGYQRTVTAKLAPGIINAGFGLPSNQTHSLTFTTEVRTVRLNIPLLRQQHSATCAVASLRMALAYKGISTDEMTIVNRIGYDPQPMDKSTDPATWDDPQQMFVGSIDGRIRDGTGAGPDAPPVAKAAKSYGVDAQAVTGISASWIAQQLYGGYPVIFFGAYNNTAEMVNWQTSTGKQILMNISSHARIIIGVQGEPTNPLGFWVHDPLSGSAYWSTAALTRNIMLDPDRQAVVIR